MRAGKRVEKNEMKTATLKVTRGGKPGEEGSNINGEVPERGPREPLKKGD